MVDKNFCMSSYLVYRYIEKEDMEFYQNMKHHNYKPEPDSKKTFVNSAEEIDKFIQKFFNKLKKKKLGLLLSGGMDSGILASYMQGMDAYTFRFRYGFGSEELERAEKIAYFNNMRLHYVDLSFGDFKEYTPIVVKNKCAPVHSIEPQIYKAAKQAKSDNIDIMIIGESADLIFGGMDKLLSKDWLFEDFVKRYTFTNPDLVLKNPVDVAYLFKRYRKGKYIDLLNFMDNVFSVESSSSYMNAFKSIGLEYIDPYAGLKMAKPLDLHRVRNGESKYLIRELFSKKYFPNISTPEKVTMPRQVDNYFKDWEGPKREEFLDGLKMSEFTGDQKWQIYCLELFLNMNEY